MQPLVGIIMGSKSDWETMSHASWRWRRMLLAVGTVIPPSADVVARMSGCAGGQSYEIPWAVPRLQQGPILAVKHETGISVEQDTPNRIRLDGKVLEPERQLETLLVEKPEYMKRPAFTVTNREALLSQTNAPSGRGTGPAP